MANDIEKITSDFSEEQTEKTHQKDGNCNRTPKSKDKKNVAKAGIINALLIFPVISVLAINVFLITMICDATDGSSQYSKPIHNTMGISMLLWALFIILSAIVVLIVHNIKSKNSSAFELKGMLIVKLGMTPLYVLGGGSSAVIAVLPGGVGLSVVFTIVGYVAMLLGSVWAICYALSLKKTGAIGYRASIILIIMEFFFVADVISAIIMTVIGRRHKRIESNKTTTSVEQNIALSEK